MKPANIDALISHFDTALRTLGGVHSHKRDNPAKDIPENKLRADERTASGRLMRINHCGEICAQALYLGQGLTGDTEETRAAMRQAAAEEVDHLAWCEERLVELDTRPSLLNPAFYVLSFAGGALAGFLGRRFNLGFVAATEEQVVRHLQTHIDRLPEADTRSRVLLAQMKEDEEHHRTTALKRGGMNFPAPVKACMTALSRVMTRTTYWI